MNKRAYRDAALPLRCVFAISLPLLLLFGNAAMAQEAAAEEKTPEPVTTKDPLVGTDVLSFRTLPLTAEELAVEANGWRAHFKVKNEEIAETSIEQMQAEGDAADALRARIADLAAERDRIARNYLHVVTAWENKGGNPDDVARYRQYHNAVLAEELRVTDVQTLMIKAFAWLTDKEGGLKLAIQVLVVVGAFLALLVIARVVRRVADRAFRRIPNLTVLLQSFLVGVVYWLTIAFGLMVVLSLLGIDITPLFALVGGAAFIIAFAMQDTLSNLASGLMIMINRPFDVGDYVDCAGTAGTVKAVSVASTTLVTPDNQVHVVPNSQVWGNIITNVTSSATRRVDLVFGIGYDDDIEKAQKVLEEVVGQHELVLAEPAPAIRVSELADSSVNFICRPWTKTEDYWTVYWDLTRTVKQAFDRAGISIPFPQRGVHVYGASVAASTNGGASGLTATSTAPRDLPPANGPQEEA